MPRPPLEWIEFPSTASRELEEPTATPVTALKAMMFPWPAPVPPITLSPSPDPLNTLTPSRPFPSGDTPSAATPMRLPSILVLRTRSGVNTLSRMPSPMLPEMTLPAAGPPIVLSLDATAPPMTWIPVPFGMAAAPVTSVPIRLSVMATPDAPT